MDFVSIIYAKNIIVLRSMKLILYPLITILLLLSSCQKDGLDSIEYFAFGNAYGMCQGNCTNFFLVKDNSVYPDDMDYYAGSSLKFKTEALPDEKYIRAKELIENFPGYLSKNPGKTFGCPDCADQGGIHIEIKENRQIKTWHFDTNISSLPPEIREYVKEISNVIEELK